MAPRGAGSAPGVLPCDQGQALTGRGARGHTCTRGRAGICHKGRRPGGAGQGCGQGRGGAGQRGRLGRA